MNSTLYGTSRKRYLHVGWSPTAMKSVKAILILNEGLNFKCDLQTMKVYFINLLSRADRDDAFRDEMEKSGVGWEFERVEAVSHIVGEIGRGESHVKALNRFISDGDEYGVIMEDDFMFVRPGSVISQIVGEVLAFRPNVLCLGFQLLDHNSYKWVSNDVLELHRVISTSCYIVRKGFAEILKQCFQNGIFWMKKGLPVHTASIDVVWQRLQGPGKRFLGIYPRVGIQRPGYSDVEKRFRDSRQAENSVIPKKVGDG